MGPSVELGAPWAHQWNWKPHGPPRRSAVGSPHVMGALGFAREDQIEDRVEAQVILDNLTVALASIYSVQWSVMAR